MTWHDLATEARVGLWSHQLRTTLSSLGIVVGVGTVVVSLAISQGAKRAALAEIGALGIDNVFVRATGVEAGRRATEAPTLTRRDADAIRTAARGIQHVAVTRLTRSTVGSGGRTTTAPVTGVNAVWAEVAGRRCDRGRWLTEEDEHVQRRVAVLGAALARRVLPGVDPLGAWVIVGDQAFRVVGVLQSVEGRAGAALQRFSPDDAVLVPWTVMDLPLGVGDDGTRVSEIGLGFAGVDPVQAATEVSAILARHHDASETRYELVVPRELLRARLRAQRTFDSVLLATGLIALTISGIGIMNIMLASVTERQPEIGVRRAVGARRRHILGQFALEAAMLCLAGGVVGVPLGGGLAWIVAWLAEWPVVLTPLSIVLALAAAAATGLAFGMYPAYRAATVDPIDALRV